MPDDTSKAKSRLAEFLSYQLIFLTLLATGLLGLSKFVVFELWFETAAAGALFMLVIILAFYKAKFEQQQVSELLNYAMTSLVSSFIPISKPPLALFGHHNAAETTKFLCSFHT